MSDSPYTPKNLSVTAAVLVIGDEILSGRTKDKNIGYIADYLTAMGIDLREVRVVPDDEDEIVSALNALRARYTFVFTTGGIGPTHDDITADAVAKALGVGTDHDPRAVAILRERFPDPADLNEARLRMARIPDGADLIDNPISKAPGFMIGNVSVMAGVPAIMQVMLDHVAPRLKTGVKMLSASIDTGGLPEGAYGTALGAIQKAHPGVIIGSYPSFDGQRFRNQIVVRAREAAILDMARADVEAMIESLKKPDKILSFNEGFILKSGSVLAHHALFCGKGVSCPPIVPKPSPSRGISFIAMRGRWHGALPPPVRSARSCASPAAVSCLPPSWRVNSISGSSNRSR
jgi:molybdenum cofactor synthesis domain-containing protein